MCIQAVQAYTKLQLYIYQPLIWINIYTQQKHEHRENNTAQAV